MKNVRTLNLCNLFRPVLLIKIICIILFNFPTNNTQAAEHPESSVPSVKEVEILRSIILGGDGGNADPVVLDAMAKQAALLPSNTSVYLLGDNIYENGMPAIGSSNRAQAEERLKRQIDPLKPTTAKIFLIPGNHDWEDSKPDGWNAIKRQESAVTELLGKGSFIPSAGCPGPVVAEEGNGATVVVADSEWFLRSYPKPSDADSGCEIWNETQFTNKLSEILKNSKEPTFFLIHHPLQSTGPHAKGGKSAQDFGHPLYSHFREMIFQTLSKNPPFICAAGHDHSLQVLKGDAYCNNYLVSGNLSHPTIAPSEANTIFASTERGFMKIDIFKNKKIRLRVITASRSDPNGKLIFEQDITRN